MRRTVKKLVTVRISTSGVIGVDDWAFKKGRNYGTVIVDLVNARIVDLLGNREAETLATSSSIVREASELASRFKNLFYAKEPGKLQKGIERAVKSDSCMKTFAKAILFDYEPVNQVIISNIRNGQAEEQENKLKAINREMYGWAGFDLLKTMILAN